MTALENAGRRMVFWGALILMGWALYEFIVMFTAMRGLIISIFEISIDARYPISKAIDTMMKNSGREFLTLLFLALCFLFGLYALLARRRPILSFFSIPVSIVLGLYALGKTSVMQVNLLQKLKMLPFVLIAAGNIICFIFSVKHRRHYKHKPPVQQDTVPIPRQQYDPFSLNKP
jgi:hypothetical protein